MPETRVGEHPSADQGDLPRQSTSLSEWQPIETAPKDGTKILVVTIHGDIEITEWFTTMTRVEEPVEVNGETLYRHSEKEYYSGWNGNTPTHWMPLPKYDHEVAATLVNDDAESACNESAQEYHSGSNQQEPFWIDAPHYNGGAVCSSCERSKGDVAVNGHHEDCGKPRPVVIVASHGPLCGCSDTLTDAVCQLRIGHDGAHWGNGPYRTWGQAPESP